MTNQTKLAAEYLSGMIERITYHNEETGFAVLKVKIPKRKDLITVTGVLPSISVGEHVKARGNWKNDGKYGLQFNAEFMRSIPPTTLEGIEKYLGSGLIKGIGAHFAKKLVEAFKDKVFDVIESTPSLLLSVDGIGKTRVKQITSGWHDQKIVREIMVFLQSHGVSTSRATKIYKAYNENAIKVVSENPYRLAKDIHGIGFLTADKIAHNLGIGSNSMIRARAGINYVLMEALSDGHCGLPQGSLLQNSEKLLEISEEILAEALSLEISNNNLVKDSIADEAVIFLGAYYAYERNIAARLKVIAQDKPSWEGIDHMRAIEWVEAKLSIELAENQKEAIRQVLSSRFTIITGGPGTGKTTLLKALLQILRAKKLKISLCAPTGRAAKRLSETTGVAAYTIHRLLKFNPAFGGFEYNQDNPLDCELLVIDESSMVDVQLMNGLLKALPQNAGLILLGDVDQLPSVGAGQVLRDIIESQKFNVIRLTQIFRQAQNSDIIINAHRINQGLLPKLELDKERETTPDFYFIPSASPEDMGKKILDLVKVRIPNKFGFDSIKDIQVLCPMQRGGCGAISLNIALQEALNQNIEHSISKYGHRYAVGDKVMQTQNNYDKEVYNGDIGVIRSINVEEQQIIISFDGRSVTYEFSDLDEVNLAYAVTIHKSQGSEYPAVIIPIAMQHYMMLRKNLLYTGVTRGKKLVILIGEKKAIAISVRSDKNTVRFSKLKEMLCSGHGQN